MGNLLKGTLSGITENKRVIDKLNQETFMQLGELICHSLLEEKFVTLIIFSRIWKMLNKREAENWGKILLILEYKQRFFASHRALKKK